jgi:type IV secretion system protein VirB10
LAADPQDGASAAARGRAPIARRTILLIMLLLGAFLLAAVALEAWLGTARPDKDVLPAGNQFGGGLAFSPPPQAKPAAAAPPAASPCPYIWSCMPHLPALAAAPATPAPKPFDPGAGDNTLASFDAGAGGGKGGAGTAAADPPGTEDALSRALTPSDLGAPARAHVMKHPDLTIPAGTLIPCTLTTAINSQLMGFVTCVLPEAVRGATGTVALLDKGTQVMGEIRSGLMQGQDRLFILWMRARTPQNVTVALASPAADELGRSGVPGAVDSHWRQILMAAAAYSLIGSGPQLAASALQSGRGNNTNFIGLGGPVQSQGENAIQREMNIPPTLEKNQGDTVAIFVARDLDFSAVFRLEQTR